MRRATAFSLLLLSLIGHHLAHPQPVRGEARATLALSEILTGGASAVDEYVRIEASGGLPVSMQGIELVYISASGLTTRRLVSLNAAEPLAPGASLLMAHVLGSFGSSTPWTWSEGIASSGGVLQLRRVGATTEVLDAVAWGSASLDAGGEGNPVPAPPAGTPMRRSRSAGGALIDTDMNRADFAEAASASPTPQPTALPSASASPSPDPSPTPTSAPRAVEVREARAVAVGAAIRVRGVVTAIPGELAEPLMAAIGDPTDGSGLFLLLPTATTGLMRGELVEVSGLMTLRRQALTLVATSPPSRVGNAELPPASAVPRPSPGTWAWEEWEGRRIRVEGVLAGSPSSLAGGAVSLRLRLGTGEELLMAASSSVAPTLPQALQEAGRRVRAEGLVHQRGSVGGGGYRLWLDPLVGLAPAPLPPADEGGAEARAGVTAPLVPDPLPIGAPTIAVPNGAERRWMNEIVTSLRVDEGRLELWRDGVIRLVVLPPCGEPVDHAGEAPYPEPR